MIITNVVHCLLYIIKIYHLPFRLESKFTLQPVSNRRNRIYSMKTEQIIIVL
jgi:hypothetical protein